MQNGEEDDDSERGGDADDQEDLHEHRVVLALHLVGLVVPARREHVVGILPVVVDGDVGEHEEREENVDRE